MLGAHADPEQPAEEWAWEGLRRDFANTFFASLPCTPEERARLPWDELRERLLDSVQSGYRHRLEVVGAEVFREIEKAIYLHTIDTCWQQHLYAMDELKEGIGFVGIGGKNPLIEYKKGAYEMFEALIARVEQETLRNLVQLRVEAQQATPPVQRRRAARYSSIHREATNLGFAGVSPAPGEEAGPGGLGAPAGDEMLLGRPAPREQLSASGGGAEGDDGGGPRAPVRVGPKVGRNDPCPCGSGKKYKKCHGREG